MPEIQTDPVGQPIPQDVPGSDAPIPQPTPPAPKKRGRPKGSKTKKEGATPAPAAVASPVLNAPSAPTPADTQPQTDPALAALANLTVDQKAALIAEAGGATMAMIASRAGPHWECTAEEFMPIARPLAVLIPSLADPKVQLALGVAAVFGPRMVVHMKLVQKQRASTLVTREN